MTRYVVAVSYQRFVRWCEDQAISPSDPSVVFVNRINAAYRYRPERVDDVVYVSGDPGVAAVLRARVRTSS